MPIGLQEMVVILLIVMLLFGAKKIPQLARGIGESIGEFKNARKRLEDEIKQEIERTEAETPAN